jgi:hypothetical protein
MYMHIKKSLPFFNNQLLLLPFINFHLYLYKKRVVCLSRIGRIEKFFLPQSSFDSFLFFFCCEWKIFSMQKWEIILLKYHIIFSGFLQSDGCWWGIILSIMRKIRSRPDPKNMEFFEIQKRLVDSSLTSTFLFFFEHYMLLLLVKSFNDIK